MFCFVGLANRPNAGFIGLLKILYDYGTFDLNMFMLPNVRPSLLNMFSGFEFAKSLKSSFAFFGADFLLLSSAGTYYWFCFYTGGFEDI